MFGMRRIKGDSDALETQREFVRKRVEEENSAPQALGGLRRQRAEGRLLLAGSVFGAVEGTSLLSPVGRAADLLWNERGVRAAWWSWNCIRGQARDLLFYFSLERLNRVTWANTFSASGFDIFYWHINYTIKWVLHVLLDILARCI